MKETLFYAKILLFGEYGVIKDSKGLLIPHNQFNGSLKISDLTLDSEDQMSHDMI